LNVLVSVEEGSLPDGVSEWSNNTSVWLPSSGSISVGDSVCSSVSCSDGSSSSIEDPPLSKVPWLMPSDSELVGAVANVSSPVEVESSAWSHLGSELEQSAIWKWWVLVLNNNLEVRSLDDSPTLVCSVVAVPEDNMTSVVIVTSMDVQALTSIISDVSS